MSSNNSQEDHSVQAMDRRTFESMVPLNIFLLQEIQRMDSVITTVRLTLESIQLAIRGEVTLTAELDKAIDAIFDARVPSQMTNRCEYEVKVELNVAPF